MVSDKFDVRAKNEAMILKNVIDNQNISRADLSKLTGLNKASVSSITKALIETDLVVETGIGDSSAVGGRKPVLLQFNPSVGAVISIDLGNNYIRGVNCYLNGEEINWVELTNTKISSINAIGMISQLFDKLLTVSTPEIVGLTISIHGVVFENKILFAPHYDLIGCDIYDQLSQIYNFPIFIENEANLLALGSYCFGISSHNLIGLSIHSGIGAGIVVDGLLQKGQSGEAGEVGHVILYPDGIKRPCGNHGCFEQYASNEVLYEEIKNVLQVEEIDLMQIKKEYYSNNKKITSVLHHNVHLLSIGINNISNLFNPHTLIINSPIYNALPELVSLVKNNLESRFSKNIIIKASQLGDRSIVYGGVALATQSFLNINQLKFV